jgi:hypothetical protein
LSFHQAKIEPQDGKRYLKRQQLLELGEPAPPYIIAAWMKLFAATRPKRKFNNLLSFDEERPTRGSDLPSGSSASRK